MKTLNISNVVMAKYLNKDESLISKYKKGKRFIVRNDNIIKQICDFFIEYTEKNNLRSDLYHLLKIDNTTDLRKEIFKFLFTKYIESSPLNDFLENLNNYKYQELTLPKVEVMITKDILMSKKGIYIGISEFREAVKRFLGTICLNSNPTTLYLYSDENMNWMTKDPDFYNTWKMLMISTLIQKNKIKIIHNINRDLNEMLKGIESWLPLYITGSIEPYYSIKNNCIFNHTLFIADHFSVISSLSTNKTSSKVYFYNTEEKVISSYKEQFESLLMSSKSLVNIYVNDNIPKKIKNEDLYTNYNPHNLDNITIKF